MRLTIALIACVALTACAGGRVGLRDLSTNGAGPDEFSVLPRNPLEIPENLNALPPPTPGGSNRADRYPIGEGIAALGGNPAAAFAGGIPAQDQALVSAAARFGVPTDIRATVAEEDAAFRGRRGNFTSGLFGGDRYFSAYAPQSLDARAELTRFRQAGVRTPSAPPAGQ
ncbi:DUF3035 domain-containing protein [Histidinibacterium aquaticum]|uniref:DUF3035 domain-containing protein n=1 Tax=Histidinibacterium aquaticum TaxID=2613962 RepID=A0A5J5GDS8_9RHOB|nr:DUF3035 domain-containing protein [Histidinibacterium aquaticum]KAA9006038.1 DUF3035 domain-containing protein [Histidinibacterium aquaticum]